MGLDFGAKTVGVAISDPLLINAQGISYNLINRIIALFSGMRD